MQACSCPLGLPLVPCHRCLSPLRLQRGVCERRRPSAAAPAQYGRLRRATAATKGDQQGPWTVAEEQPEAARGGGQGPLARLLQIPQLPQLQGSPAQPDNGSGDAAGQPAVPAMEPVSEVFENQRGYGVVGWKAPVSILDAPEFSDAAGAAVALPARPSDDPSRWELVVGGATDDEGWQYATVFKHLEYKRPGGRSSARFGDTVRRRLWRRRPEAAEAAPAVAVPLRREGAAGAAVAAVATAATAVVVAAVQGSEEGSAGEAAGAVASAVAVRATREAEAKKKAVKAFINMVLDVLRRRPIWTLLPWDPAALFLLYQKHQRVYQELQAQAYERRLFTADQPPPPSQLREGRTLLQDMLCAAMHSRAAYGFPAAHGYMGTVADYVKLQTLQPLTFDAVGGVSAEANNESAAALGGFDVEDLVMAEWRNTPFRPCHYVAVDRANQCVVLSIRGSLQVGDLLSDLAAAPMEVVLGGADGWVHQGIFSAATFIHCNTQQALQEAARRCPGWPLLLVGHSLGGGVAALVTLLLQESRLPEGMGPVRCITMGTAAVMSRPLAEKCEDLVTSVIVGSDVVPHLSMASVEAVLVEASEASPVRRTVQGWGSKLAGALSQGRAKQAELSEAAAAAAAAVTSAARVGGSWAAVKEASAQLGRSASSAGLARLVSAGGRGQPPRQVPVLVQPAAAAAQPAWQQRLKQPHVPHQIPVIDLGEQQQEQQQQQQQQQQQEQQAAAPVGGDGAEQLSQVLPAADAAGLEGFFAADAGQGQGPTAGAAAPPPAPQQQQAAAAEQQPAGKRQRQDDLLPHVCEFDAWMAEAAVAQQAAALQATPPAGPPARGDTGGETGGENGGGPGNPELLFPPGRIIWIFPADEDEAPLQADAEQQLGAMEAAWEGGAAAPEAIGAAAAVAAEAQGQGQGGGRQAAERQEGQDGGGRQPAGPPGQGAGGSRGRYEVTNADPAVRSWGAVDMEEAAEAVEAGAGGATAAGQPRRQAVAVDADRASFERLLLMADMLDDHLPDRYVAALQQL